MDLTDITDLGGVVYGGDLGHEAYRFFLLGDARDSRAGQERQDKNLVAVARTPVALRAIRDKRVPTCDYDRGQSAW